MATDKKSPAAGRPGTAEFSIYDFLGEIEKPEDREASKRRPQDQLKKRVEPIRRAN